MKKLLDQICILVFILTASSCSKDNGSEGPLADTTKPVISLVDPTNSKIFTLGSSIHLQADLNDNDELKSYKIVIGKSMKGLQTSDWAFSQTWPITPGKKAFNINHNEIIVPLTITGNQTTTGDYYLTITCLDVTGNEGAATLSITLTK